MSFLTSIRDSLATREAARQNERIDSAAALAGALVAAARGAEPPTPAATKKLAAAADELGIDARRFDELAAMAERVAQLLDLGANAEAASEECDALYVRREEWTRRRDGLLAELEAEGRALAADEAAAADRRDRGRAAPRELAELTVNTIFEHVRLD